jgi:hypothetical protein
MNHRKIYLYKYLLIAMMYLATMITSVGTAQAAFSVTDLNTADLNTINDYGQSAPGNYWVTESYGERNLIPYPSHDGNAIVNSQNEFFTKKVNIDNSGRIVINFSVTNASPYKWSDYHFLLGKNVSLVSATSDVFQNSKVVVKDNELSFWAPDWVMPGQTVNFSLTMDAQATDFNLDQLATTTPIPAAFWLFGSGLLGLARIGKSSKGRA